MDFPLVGGMHQVEPAIGFSHSLIAGLSAKVGGVEMKKGNVESHLRIPVRLCLTFILGLLILAVGCKGSTSGPDAKEGDGKTTQGNGNEVAALTQGTATLNGFTDASERGPEKNCYFSFEQGASVNFDDVNPYPGEKDGNAIRKKLDADSETKEAMKQKYDLFYDRSHGIVTNAKFPGWELGIGDGGIIDAGAVELGSIKEAPESGYAVGLRLSDGGPPAIAKLPKLEPGHCYIVRTGTGKFGKLQVSKLDLEKGVLEFQWVYQSDGSRRFE